MRQAQRSGYSSNTLQTGLLYLVVLLLVAAPGGVAAQKIQEYHIKSVFLYNLAHFVYWPETSADSDTPFTIAIYGPDPFGEILDQTVNKESKFGRPLHIRRINDPSQLDTPLNILFISEESMGEWPQLQQIIADRPILTVADTRKFTRQGGMVSLLKEGRKISLEINNNSVRKSGLKMSAKLLRLANLVE